MQVRTLPYRRLYRDQDYKPPLDSELHFTNFTNIYVNFS